jgi:hypothetical protein
MSITACRWRPCLVTDPAEAQKVLKMMPPSTPAHAADGTAEVAAPEGARCFASCRMFSVLDYTKGFAHTDLVTC